MKKVKRLQQKSDQDGNTSLGKQGISQHMDGITTTYQLE